MTQGTTDVRLLEITHSKWEQPTTHCQLQVSVSESKECWILLAIRYALISTHPATMVLKGDANVCLGVSTKTAVSSNKMGYVRISKLGLTLTF